MWSPVGPQNHDFASQAFKPRWRSRAPFVLAMALLPVARPGSHIQTDLSLLKDSRVPPNHLTHDSFSARTSLTYLCLSKQKAVLHEPPAPIFPVSPES